MLTAYARTLLASGEYTRGSVAELLGVQQIDAAAGIEGVKKPGDSRLWRACDDCGTDQHAAVRRPF